MEEKTFGVKMRSKRPEKDCGRWDLTLKKRGREVTSQRVVVLIGNRILFVWEEPVQKTKKNLLLIKFPRSLPGISAGVKKDWPAIKENDAERGLKRKGPELRHAPLRKRKKLYRAIKNRERPKLTRKKGIQKFIQRKKTV